MSIIDQQRDLEAFSEQMLVQEAQAPSGRYPQFLVVTEIERRRDLRNRFAAAQAQSQLQQPPVLEQRVAEMQGIPSVDPVPSQQGAPQPRLQQGIAAPMPGANAPVPGYAVGGQVQGGPGDPRFRLPEYSREQLRKFSVFPSFGFPFMDTEQFDALDSGAQFRRPQYMTPARTPRVPQQVPAQGAQNAVQLPPDEASVPPVDFEAWIKEQIMGATPGMGYTDPGFDETARELAKMRLAGARKTSGLLTGSVADQEAQIRAMQEGGARTQDVYGQLAELYRGRVQGEPSEYEAELRRKRMGPERQKQELMAVALSGLGSLIGGNARAQDVIAGMGGVTQDVLGMSRQQQAEDIEILDKLTNAKERRDERNFASLTGALQADGMAAESSVSLATKVLDAKNAITDRLIAANDAITNAEIAGQEGILNARMGEADLRSKAESTNAQLLGARMEIHARVFDILRSGETDAAKASAINGLIAWMRDDTAMTPEQKQWVEGQVRTLTEAITGGGSGAQAGVAPTGGVGDITDQFRKLRGGS